MWTLQPRRSICTLHQAPCHACHECITNLKRQRIRFALNSHTYFEGSKKRKTIFAFICVFFVLHSCGPVFLRPVASLDPGELPVVFLECTSAGNIFSHFSLFCLIFPHRGIGGFSGYRILVDGLHPSPPLLLCARVWPIFSLPLWFSVLISMMWVVSFICLGFTGLLNLYI